MAPTRNLRLSGIASGFLTGDSRFRSTLIQVYSCSSDVDLVVEKFFNEIKQELVIDTEHPLTFTIGKFNDFDILLAHEFQYVDPEHRFVFFSKIDQIRLPDTPLILFASPLIHSNGHTNAARAHGVISIYKSILLALFGRGFLLDKIIEFSIEGDGGHKISYGSGLWRVPQPVDCRALVDPRLYEDLISRIPLQIEPVRSQIVLACQFFSRALEEDQEYKRFFDYWTAFEILVQGKAQKIRKILAEAYGADVNFVNANLRFEEIANLRHDLIHFGKFKSLEPEVERRIQILFFDLIRHRLNLPCARAAERLQA